MPNLTVSVPEDIYRQARIEAAKQGRSISSLVADFLSSLGRSGDPFNRLLSQQEAVLTEIESFRAGDRLERDRLHDRGVR